MSSATYAAGSWVAVSAPSTWLLVDLPPDDARVQRCWSLISQADGGPEILDALAADGIRATPAFALVHAAGDERWAVARGAGLVTIETSGTPLAVVSGGDAQLSWAEAGVGADVDTLVIANGEEASAVEMPMAAGVTMAARVRVLLAAVAEDRMYSSAGRSGAEPAAPRPSPAPAPVPAAAPDPVEPEQPDAEVPSYDHLFGATQRPEEVPVPAPAEPAYESTAASPDATGIWLTMPPPDALLPPPPGSGLIDGVPWAAPVAPASNGAWPPPAPLPSKAEQPPQAPPESPQPAPLADPTRTVDRSALRAQSAAGGATVLAGYCPAGHLAPPHAPQCRVCGAPMPADQAGFEIARPPLGVLRLSTGDVVTLDRGVLLGRAPEVPPDATVRPHALRLASPENDISRTHAEVVLDGWHVYVRDLESTNGTVVTLPGQPPLRLRPGEPQLLEHGATVTLAEEVSFTFEVVA